MSVQELIKVLEDLAIEETTIDHEDLIFNPEFTYEQCFDELLLNAEEQGLVKISI